MAVQDCDPAHPLTCFDRAWSTLHPPPTAIRACNVAGPAMAAALCNWAERNWGTTVRYARPQRRFGGMVNGYRDYRRLGIDRWLAMLAAWQHSDGKAALCVIDIGTATTVDVVDPQGPPSGRADPAGADRHTRRPVAAVAPAARPRAPGHSGRAGA